MEKRELHMRRIRIKWIAAIVSLAVISCSYDKPIGDNGDIPIDNPDTNVTVKKVEVPEFSADSAYAYIEKQVSFGPRVPNTPEHFNCANFLISELQKFTDTLILQRANTLTWDNKTITMSNIIGVLSPEKNNRILLCAHWDTRPMADEDDSSQKEPILGANDGASGVGVLLEIARQMSINRPDLGVDFIFFDAEDWGNPGISNSFCLGSQHWANNPHDKHYRAKARYGICLDMVGKEGAIFAKEGTSMMHARGVMNKVWKTGQNLGYSNFVNYIRGAIIDDHAYVSTDLGVPCIDIINYDVNTGGFGEFWHTHDDNMSIIGKSTLKAVGQTVMEVVYNEKN
jgi:hypothetical protein